MSFKSNLYHFQFTQRQKIIGKYYEIFSNKKIKINPKVFAPKKVLFVVAGLLGDSVMSIPAVIAARNIWQNSHFTLLGRKHNRELFSACPFIDEFYDCSADPFSLSKSNEIVKLQNWLRSQNFDLAIILLGDQFAHLTAKAKIPVRVGVKGTPLDACLTDFYEIGSPRTWGPAERLNAIRTLGYSVDTISPQLWVEDAARASARQKLKTLGLNSGEKYVVAHPFGSTPRQWWDVEKAAEVAGRLRSNFGLQTVLIGGKETVPAVTESLKKEVVDTTGQLLLPELLAVIDESTFVITTDSGPFHIAGALNKNIIGLFRSSRPEHARQYPTARVLFGQNSLCDNSCQWDYCSNNPCRQLKEISVENVLSFSREFIN